jgi:hypothetical protein
LPAAWYCLKTFNTKPFLPERAFSFYIIIALFEFEQTSEGIKVSSEKQKHYRLVRPNDLSPEKLETYRIRPD